MRHRLLDTPTSACSVLRRMHQKEPRTSDMDASRIDYPRTIAGCAAVILLLCVGILLGRCSAPAAAQSQETQVPLTLDAATSIGNDGTIDAQASIAEALTALTTTTTTTVPVLRNTPPATSSAERWDQLAQCETGGRWDANDGNGYGGALQFAHSASWSTWLSYGGGEYAPNPWDASKEEQIAVAENVLARSGWRAWPGCSRKFGWL